MEMETDQNSDICRVCRCEATPDKPLYHPCICTGSIKYIHQECLMQWLKYSEKEFCELCNYRFSFIPIYSPDMPKRLPLKDIFSVIARCLGTVARYWVQYTLVALAWLVVIPLTAYRIYMFLFNYSFDDFLSLSIEFNKPENLFSDGFYGCCVVMCTLVTFIFLIWLREQIIRVGAPDWLERPLNFRLFQAIFRAAGGGGERPDQNQNFAPPEGNNLLNNNNNNNDDVNNVNNNNNNNEDRAAANEQQQQQQPAAAANPQEGPQNPPLDWRENGDLDEDNDADIEDAADVDEQIVPPADNPQAIDAALVGGVQVEPLPPAANEGAAVVPAANAPAGGRAAGNRAQVAVAQDWNPVIEWDRGAEDITWERILGLDGTFAFLENVFWVITLNTLFIFIFAYCPYHIGNLAFRQLLNGTLITSAAAGGVTTETAAATVNATGNGTSEAQAATVAATATATATAEAAAAHLVSAQFDRFVIIFLGYFIIGFLLFLLHTVFSLTHLQRIQRFFGFCYIIVKVALLVTLEIGLFPFVIGWWLDVCSLPLFGTTLDRRLDAFFASPGTSLFIHWLVGMICIFYFVSFVLMVKETVRPGMLWFIRNLNDPNFNPVNEMIHLPIVVHCQRCVLSMVVFAAIVMLVVLFPILAIQRLLPDFLPYNNVANNESPFELILELFVFRILLPNIIEANDFTFRQLIKSVIKIWCQIFSYILNIKSYLLGDDDDDDEEEEEEGEEGEGENQHGHHHHGHHHHHRHRHHRRRHRHRQRDAQQQQQQQEEGVNLEGEEEAEAAGVAGAEAEVPIGGEAEHENGQQAAAAAASQQARLPYERPRLFVVRLLLLVGSFCGTLFLFGVFMLTVPIMTGRELLDFFNSHVDISDIRVNEFYTAAIGIYGNLVLVHSANRFVVWVREITRLNSAKLVRWMSLLGKLLVSGVLLFGAIPLLLGVLFDVVILMPLRVPANQTPILYLWQDYAFGILLTNVVCVIKMMADVRFKDIMEQIYNNGLANTNLKLIVFELAIPNIALIGLILAVPYVVVNTALPLAGASFELVNLVNRRVHSMLFLLVALFFFGKYQVNKFIRFYEHIRDSKYLVGRRLQNYDHKSVTK